jgi:hypothetical protein
VRCVGLDGTALFEERIADLSNRLRQKIAPMIFRADLYNRRRPHSSLDGSTPDHAYFTPLPLRIAA